MFKKIIAWFKRVDNTADDLIMGRISFTGKKIPKPINAPKDTEKLEVEAEKVEEVKEIKSKRNGNKRRPRKKVVKEN